MSLHIQTTPERRLSAGSAVTYIVDSPSEAHQTNNPPATTETYQADSQSIKTHLVDSPSATTEEHQANNPPATTEMVEIHQANSPFATNEMADIRPPSSPFTSSELVEEPASSAWEQDGYLGQLKDSVEHVPTKAYRCNITQKVVFVWSLGPTLLVVSGLLQELYHQFVRGEAFPAKRLYVMPIAEAICEMEMLLDKCEAQHRHQEVKNLQEHLRKVLYEQVSFMAQSSITRSRMMFNLGSRCGYVVSVLGLLVGRHCVVEVVRLPKERLLYICPAYGATPETVRLVRVKRQANHITMVFHFPAEPWGTLLPAVVNVKDSASMKEAGIHYDGEACSILDSFLCCVALV
jgi:hypothetical protein